MLETDTRLMECLEDLHELFLVVKASNNKLSDNALFEFVDQLDLLLYEIGTEVNGTEAIKHFQDIPCYESAPNRTKQPSITDTIGTADLPGPLEETFIHVLGGVHHNKPAGQPALYINLGNNPNRISELVSRFESEGGMAEKDVREIPLYVLEANEISVSAIRRYSRNAVRMWGVTLLLVDGVENITRPSEISGAVDQVVSRLHRIAGELGCRILFVSQ